MKQLCISREMVVICMETLEKNPHKTCSVRIICGMVENQNGTEIRCINNELLTCSILKHQIASVEFINHLFTKAASTDLA